MAFIHLTLVSGLGPENWAGVIAQCFLWVANVQLDLDHTHPSLSHKLGRSIEQVLSLKVEQMC